MRGKVIRKTYSILVSSAICLFLSSCTKNCAGQNTNVVPQSGLAGEHSSPKPSPQAINSERTILTGRIVEAIQRDGFSYLRLQLPEGREEWIALVGQNGNVGEMIKVEEQAVLHDFESKSLKRSFSKIIFGQLVKKN
jgi:hypothetical protein